MRLVPLSIAMVVFASAGCAQNVTIDLKNQFITQDMQTLVPHIGGRMLAKTLPAPMPAGAISYVHEWPAIYFEADFTGENIFLKFDDPANEYRVLIDDLAPLTLAQPGTSEVAINGLKDGPHHIRLEKVTESAWIIGSFDGFYMPKGAQGDAAQPRPRQIEFIGDSDMTGYGIRSTSRTCTQEEVRLLSDAQIGYPALLAKALDADYQLNAISGRGLIRNYGGTNVQDAMIYAYPDILPDVGAGVVTRPYSDPNWKPQIIVIAIGENDFSTPLLAGEKWESNDALIDDFIRASTSFLQTLYKTNPNAAVIMMKFDAPILTETEKSRMAYAQENTLQNTARATGFRMVNLVSIEALAYDQSACHYHASTADQQRRADWLADYIRADPEFWDQKQP